MPATNLATYVELADSTASRLTSSHREWTGFLKTAARLYKYPYHEQMMIYAQRPDATACAEYDIWNNRMRRYIRRGSKGIALLDTSGDTPKLRYVFDVADTGGRENSLTPKLWEVSEENEPVVAAALEKGYDITTTWSKCGSNSIYAYRDSVKHIGYIPHFSSFPSKEELREFDYTSRARTVYVGEVVIWVNSYGHFAATRVVDVCVMSRGATENKLVFEYKIYT